MTVNEIVDELRATRPRAERRAPPSRAHRRIQPPGARHRHCSTGFAAASALRCSSRAAAGLAVVAAVAIGVTRPTPVAREATAPASASVRERHAGGTPEAFSGDRSGGRARPRRAGRRAPGPVTGRAQRYSASLTLAVEDTDALSEATQRALAIARDLGGYVVAVRYATGDEGASSVTLRVPSAAQATRSPASRTSGRSSHRTSRSRISRSRSTGSTRSCSGCRRSSPR